MAAGIRHARPTWQLDTSLDTSRLFQPNKFSFSDSTKSQLLVQPGLGFAFFVVLAARHPPLLRIGWSSGKLFLCWGVSHRKSCSKAYPGRPYKYYARQGQIANKEV